MLNKNEFKYDEAYNYHKMHKKWNWKTEEPSELSLNKYPVFTKTIFIEPKYIFI